MNIKFWQQPANQIQILVLSWNRQRGKLANIVNLPVIWKSQNLRVLCILLQLCQIAFFCLSVTSKALENSHGKYEAHLLAL